MPRVIAILLLLSLSFQCLVKLGVVAWYEINKSYVSQVLCENKNKPQMKCHGKCYLKKQLAKTGKTEDQSRDKTEHSSQIGIDFLVSATINFSYTFSSIVAPKNGVYIGFDAECIPHSIFHPPGVAA